MLTYKLSVLRDLILQVYARGTLRENVVYGLW